MNFLNYILAGYPLLWVETHEEYRALSTICSQLSKAKEPYHTFAWDEADGVRPIGIKNGVLASGEVVTVDDAPIIDPADMLNWLDSQPNNHILFMKDGHNALSKASAAPMYRRKIRNLLPRFKAVGKVLVIVSPIVDIPVELDKEISVIPFKLPDREEIRKVLHAVCESGGINQTHGLFPTDDEELIDSALGMTSFEAENAFSVSLVEAHKFDPKVIRREKAAIVRKSETVEVVESEYTLDDIGGLENLKDWLLERKNCFSEEARNFGVTPPKGLLLVGVPGTGKSLAAKAASSALGRPLLRLDFGNIFGKYVGDSEANMRRVQHLVEAVAPCILWMDELEKGLGGMSGGGDTDGGTTKRVFQQFLTWLQERKSDVFIMATANSVEALPPELLRPGRIDGIFWVDLPDTVQRQEILGIHLGKKGRKLDTYKAHLDQLISMTDHYSGAEIETWVKNALTRAFSLGHKDLLIEDLLETVATVTPVYNLMGEKIKGSQEWAKKHGALQASKKHEEVKADITPTKGRKLSVAG